MKKFLIVTICVLATNAVHAQQSSQQPSPEMRALNMRIGSEINANLQCSTNSIALQDKLTAAEAEMKRLTDKYEPKKNDPAEK